MLPFKAMMQASDQEMIEQQWTPHPEQQLPEWSVHISDESKKKTIASIRYKVYIFFIVVILVFMWPMFEWTVDKVRGVWSMDNAFALSEIGNLSNNLFKKRWEWGLLNDVDSLDKKIEDVQASINKANNELSIIDRLNNEGKRNTIITCLNTWDCEGVPEDLVPFLWFFRTYMLIDSLEWEKMRFNQKLVLKNINDFLLKTVSWLGNGELLSITFWSPVSVDSEYNLFRIPITLRVTFEHEEMLMSFLHNVEERVHLTIPILYKIDSMNYDIVNYSQEQTVAITMNAYYIAWLDTWENDDDVIEGSTYDEIALEDLDQIGEEQ